MRIGPASQRALDSVSQCTAGAHHHILPSVAFCGNLAHTGQAAHSILSSTVVGVQRALTV